MKSWKEICHSEEHNIRTIAQSAMNVGLMSEDTYENKSAQHRKTFKGLKWSIITLMLTIISSFIVVGDVWAYDLAYYGYYIEGGDCPAGYKKLGPNCYNSTTKSSLRPTTPETVDPLLKNMQPELYAQLENDYAAIQKKNAESSTKKSGDCSSVTCGAGEVLNPANCSCVKTKNDTASEILDKYSVKDTAPQKFDSVYDSVDKSGSNNTDGSGESGGGNSAGGQSGGTEGSTTSGYVSNVEDVAQGIDNDFGMGICKEGSIFKQLACRAGYIGDGLRKVAYIIAGLALIVFSFAAIFGKVKWPVFCTIVFCCFLLSVVVFVVNTMTAKENSAAWIGGINDDGSVVSYQSTNEEMAANQNVDASGKQFSDEERPQ